MPEDAHDGAHHLDPSRKALFNGTSGQSDIVLGTACSRVSGAVDTCTHTVMAANEPTRPPRIGVDRFRQHEEAPLKRTGVHPSGQSCQVSFSGHRHDTARVRIPADGSGPGRERLRAESWAIPRQRSTSGTGAELLFQVLTEREEKNSVAMASNESFGGWTKTFTGPRLCAAIVDRLTFNGTIIETGTDSYRLATTRARAEQPAVAG